MISPLSITDTSNNSHETLPLFHRNSSAVDDVVVKADPILYDTVVEAQSSSLGSGDAPEERQSHTTSVSIPVESDPHTTSEPFIQVSRDVAQHIASMASDRANGNGLTAVGSQVPSAPPLEGIEGAVAEAQSSSSGDAPQGSRPPRIPIDPMLYDAIVEGNVEVLEDFLQSQASSEMTSPVSITDSSNNSHQILPLIIRNSSAVDDMVVKTDPMLYDAVVEAQSSSLDSGDAPEERGPHTISVSIPVESDPHTTSEPLVQVSRDVAQHIASMAFDSADGNGLTAVGSQVPAAPPLEGIEGAVAEAQSSSLGDAPQRSRPPRIPIDPMLYDAVVKGNVEVLDDFLQSQDLLLLDGVTIGDNTVLHIAASSNRDLTWQGTSDNVDFAREVYLRNRSLLTASNRLKDTPLHCAAKAGNYRMVSRLISFAEQEDQAVKQTLLTARNIHGETALHEAVRFGHGNIVDKLIRSEPSITGIVDADGISPLYLATMMNALHIVEIFTKEEPSSVSCAGPKGQTALHVAVLQYTGITRTLLEWNKSLATKVDDVESTPLHYAASVGNLETVKLLLGDDEIKKAAYMADKNELFPIHTAAKCGNALIIKELINQFSDLDELLDTQGRNYIHLAIQSGNGFLCVVGDNDTRLRVLNARDYQGNTPLHLAGESGQFNIVRFLISVKMVHSSIMNRNGLTPVDLALKQMNRGFRFLLDTKFNILRCMMWSGALPSPRRADHICDDLQIPTIDKEREIQKVDSITRNVVIISVLIATVTFAASFTMPGGYIADDHMNRGTPILSRKYAFKAFIVADLLAFLLSMVGTTCLIYAGSGNVGIELRKVLLGFSIYFVAAAGRATICAFALAIYTMLYQVNLEISILVCVASFGLLPLINPAYRVFLSLALPIVKRKGWRGLYKPHLGPWTSMRYTLGVWMRLNFSNLFFAELLTHIILYGFIFGLALI